MQNRNAKGIKRITIQGKEITLQRKKLQYKERKITLLQRKKEQGRTRT